MVSAGRARVARPPRPPSETSRSTPVCPASSWGSWELSPPIAARPRAPTPRAPSDPHALPVPKRQERHGCRRGGLRGRSVRAHRDRAARDPTQVARDFCQAKGFSATIAVPLAVKLEQARDKSRRLERAARQGRPVTAKPVMASTLTEEAKAALKAKEARAKAKARAAAERRSDGGSTRRRRRRRGARRRRRGRRRGARPRAAALLPSSQARSPPRALPPPRPPSAPRASLQQAAARQRRAESWWRASSHRRAPAGSTSSAPSGREAVACRVAIDFAQKEAARLRPARRGSKTPRRGDRRGRPERGAASLTSCTAASMRKKEKAEALLKLKEAAQKAGRTPRRARTSTNP